MFNTVKSRGSRDCGLRIAGCGLKNVQLNPKSEIRNPKSARRVPPRRGVLLLVVLSMLVLFMLVGTAFLMTSSQSDKASKGSAKNNRVGNYGTKLLDRALMEVLRDTDNVNSVVRYHSLLRDVYGTDGFQGVVYRPGTADLTRASSDLSFQPTTYAGITANPATQPPLGTTQGQFIDIYVRALGWDLVTNKSIDDPLTTTVDEASIAGQLSSPDLRHLLKLERNVYGQPQLHSMSLTKGYYNGCLLTVTSGPAAGQSARVVDYEYVVDPATAASTTVVSKYFRFRVMAFGRADGQPLQVDQSRSPEIGDLAGATFIVNGRAYGGTGAGFNQLTTAGQPKLSAARPYTLATGDVFGAELALLPNSVFFNPLATPVGAVSGFIPASSIPPTGIPKLNNPTPVQTPATFYNYPTFVGPGGANESYDAADFQNMFLALQTVTPRAQGRVVQDNASVPLSVADAAVNSANFLRLDLEDVPLPSFHRPDLINFWNHRLLGVLTAPAPNGLGMSPDAAAQAILNPTAAGVDPQAAALALAIKRQSSLRPLREDHPNFDGSNPLSVPGAISSVTTGLTRGTVPNLNIAVPYWEAVGPWDVDNDNDGIPDSIWVDLGDAVQEAEDGTRYKPLYAFLIIDLDSRLNVNAHGLADDIVPTVLDNTKNTFFDLTSTLPGWPGNLAHTATAPIIKSTLQLARGSGYGPAEISLRSVFRAPLDASLNPTYGNRDENLPSSTSPVDSLAALMGGRIRQNGTTVDGKFGFNPNTTSPILGDAATAGTNYRFTSPVPTGTPGASQAWYTGETATPDLSAQLKFFDYPWSLNQRSAFGTPPDLKGRYATGLDYIGQPAYEVVNDVNPNTAASATKLYFNLLAKSPYELDLSRSQRRDAWATGVNSTILDTASAFNLSLNQNDDAPFSTTDLEKVLRAWDPESGTLPSRLWDVVNDFDPVKLLTYDPNRVVQASLTAFGTTSQPELLASAQQMAGVSRRLVTTDSFSMPVASENFASKLPFGADGLPGLPGVDDDGNGVVDDLSELNQATFANGCDDYAIVMNEVRTRTGSVQFQLSGPDTPRIIDYLRYRIILELLRKNIIAPSTPIPDPQIEALVNNVMTGGYLAPELIAGVRMDLNRPFGDGKDSNGDGVVDDPLEAGEPFVDVSGNGKWDAGEPFLDLDGDNNYTAPGDILWQQLGPAAVGGNNTLAEPISFDYTNGHAEPIYKTTLAGGIRNLEAQGRQFFARQLYCLMLMLVDENYIAPWNENDPQIMAWIESEKAKLTIAPLSLPAPQADLIVKRKLTCREVAQWAINCVDIRDSDVIMTPFEYDENPWDGWGCLDAKGFNIPLDGDPATDENKGEMIDWANVPNNPKPNTKKLTTLAAADVPTVLNQTRGIVWGAERPELLISETLAFHDRRTENLLSADSTGGHGQVEKKATPPTPGAGSKYYPDTDLDQGLRPQGSAFVELVNPQGQVGQYPAELYSRLDVSTGYKYDPAQPAVGVDLGRLSNLAWDDVNGHLTTAASDLTKNIKRSPVWRMIVVNEWPNAKNTGDAVQENHNDLVFPAGYKEPKVYSGVAAKLKAWGDKPVGTPPWTPTDPDFDPLFGSDLLQRPGRTLMYGPTFAAVDKEVGNKNEFNVAFPNIEREFYFTTDKSPAKFNATTGVYEWSFLTTGRADLNIRIPDRSIKLYGPGTTDYGQTQSFIPAKLERSSLNQPAIAPITPGHYAVVGSAGTNYATDPAAQPDPNAQVYTTTIGRQEFTGQSSNLDKMHEQAVLAFSVRRIQMFPNPELTNPLQPKQQLLVGSNGGDPKDEIHLGTAPNVTYDPYSKEIVRDNELINDRGTVKNIYDSKPADGTVTGAPNNRYYPPCVTIPVEGMNVSEPPWGYGPREKEAVEQEKVLRQQNGLSAAATFIFRKTNDRKEGRYFRGAGATNNVDSYDKPFDTAPELVRTGTTANYRIIHLQRLANPLLPWNPPPLLADGKTANPEHRANAPINPYLTIDSSSVNLTTFNGTSNGEHDIDPTTQVAQGKIDPGNIVDIGRYLTNFNANRQAFFFRSQERGYWSRLNLVGSNPTAPATVTTLPQRVLWAQEPANVLLKKSNSIQELIDLVTNRQMTSRYVDEMPGDVKTNQNPKGGNNYINMVLEHSLGFGNKSFGLLYDYQGAKQPGFPDAQSTASSLPPVATASGAPAPSRFIFTHNVNTDGTLKTNPAPVQVNSTNPWLEWANRPFISAEELLKVPSGSQATMLRTYSTIDNGIPAANSVNPYGLAQVGTSQGPVLNAIRWAVMQGSFGQLTNMFASTVTPLPSGQFVPGIADVVRDLATGVPVPDAAGSVQPYGAPSFYRILDYVQVPSRYVGTDTLLNAETFNDVPGVVDGTSGTVGSDILSPSDPRYNFQPPFNKVSRERDPGRVNLNTVTGRRVAGATNQVWSDVFDGIMHRDHDQNPSANQLGHLGPAWRDVVLSRRGYPQVDAAGNSVEQVGTSPDVFQFGLSPNFPTMFANPFRSAAGGDLVPIAGMVQTGVEATLLRSHPYAPANPTGNTVGAGWGRDGFDDNGDGLIDDEREAGIRPTGNDPNGVPYANDQLVPSAFSHTPLFSESTSTTFAEGGRNPSMMYQSMTRLGNLVTDRSGVFGIWITVGYFEVEKAPDWNDPDATVQAAVRARFGGDPNLYNRTYPDGYMLGRELGSDTGDVKRPRGFYIIDRTEEVGFKPGEDLNVEKTIRLRRRIE